MTGIIYSEPLFCVTLNDQKHLTELQSLIKSDLPYIANITGDSIILWEKEVSPLLEKQNDYATFFQLKQIVVSAYALRGDISLAVDQARLMHKKAQELDDKIGIALSLRAIGNAYISANMTKQAVESYEKAILLYEDNSDEVVKLLPELVILLIKKGEVEKATKYLKQLDETYTKATSNITKFFVPIAHAYYCMEIGATDEAKTYIAEADAARKIIKEPYYDSVVDLAKAYYFEAIGDNNQALSQFNKLIAENTPLLISAKHINLYIEQANLLERMGLKDQACALYQLANVKRDSLSAISYARQINDLRTTYQIDILEIQNEKQRSSMFFWVAIVMLSVMAIVGSLIVYTIKKNKHLRLSKMKLEEAKKFSEDSIRTKSLFISNMSHEIRTPLNALSGFSSILTEDNIDNETRQQCNNIIKQNSELLLKLINDVVNLSNIEIGKLNFTFKAHDAVAICRNVVETVEKVKQTEASVNFVTTLESFELTTDASRLQQVLINLLVNATKFTPSGSITLELSAESSEFARFTVTDTGCGIPLEKQKSIFNRFEKLNEGAQGTGLGLSICQLIIEHIGGSIEIDSQYTSGSRFIFTHPIHPTMKQESTK